MKIEAIVGAADMRVIKIIPILNLPVIKEGDDLGGLICKAADEQGAPLQDGDILIVTHIIVSRAEGNVINLDEVSPSEFARTLASEHNRDPALIEVILRESRSIVRMGGGHIISETKHGFICANAGVDKSNVPGERNVAPLPEDPDASAQRIRRRIRELTGNDVAVIISDTHGRALRRGEINVAIGVAGIKPIRDRRDETDLFGYTLRIKQTAIADELCSAAELVIGQADEGVPAAIIRGYPYERAEEASARELIWPREKALFI
ncbi:MAG: F420-0--gamma-glutamyl ligase [Candidatus Bathyarchaeota archaeon B63]|nr:MAG: F420-0--gamma-glutamyl ligase [Candidatus Bathyarchaeota archaeon B63]